MATPSRDLEALARSLATGFGANLELRFLEQGPERVRVSMEVDERVRQGLGLVHGGALMTLADIAATLAAYAAGAPDRDHVTVEFHARFLESARTGPLVAEARPVKVGRRLSFWEVRIADPDDRLVASIAVTFAAIRPAD